MKKYFYLLPIVFILAGSVWWFTGRKKSQLLIQPKQGPIVESIYGLGTVQSDNVYTLKLGVTTMIRKLFVKEGEIVVKGQQLVQFDEQGLQPQYAPFEGSITQINYFAGETVFPQSPILTLMDLKNRYISVALDQDGAIRVRPNQKALLSFDSLNKTSLIGTVRAIFPRQGQLVAHIVAQDLPGEILPGMTADVAIIVGEKERATLIPLKVIKQNTILLRKNGETLPTTVQLGIVDAEWGEVLSPSLSPDDSIEIPAE